MNGAVMRTPKSLTWQRHFQVPCQRVLAQLFFPDQVRRLVIMFGQVPRAEHAQLVGLSEIVEQP